MSATEVIALIGSILALLVSVTVIVTFFSNKKKAGYDEGRDDGGLRGDVKYVRNGIDDLRLDFKEMSKKYDAQAERLTRVEESCKQAHKRLDEIARQK